MAELGGERVFFPSPCRGLGGPAAAARPFWSMSPGVRLRRIRPPLLPRKGLPAMVWRGLRHECTGGPGGCRAPGVVPAPRSPRSGEEPKMTRSFRSNEPAVTGIRQQDFIQSVADAL